MHMHRRLVVAVEIACVSSFHIFRLCYVMIILPVSMMLHAHQEGYDSLRALMHLEEPDLETMIAKKGHMKMIRAALKILQNGEAGSAPPLQHAGSISSVTDLQQSGETKDSGNLSRSSVDQNMGASGAQSGSGSISERPRAMSSSAESGIPRHDEGGQGGGSHDAAAAGVAADSVSGGNPAGDSGGAVVTADIKYSDLQMTHTETGSSDQYGDVVRVSGAIEKGWSGGVGKRLSIFLVTREMKSVPLCSTSTVRPLCNADVCLC